MFHDTPKDYFYSYPVTEWCLTAPKCTTVHSEKQWRSQVKGFSRYTTRDRLMAHLRQLPPQCLEVGQSNTMFSNMYPHYWFNISISMIFETWSSIIHVLVYKPLLFLITAKLGII
jgi:hypothetical protein